ncbi:hypothetical protein AB0J83_14330 [Actinoplanes sp. NPDC049596]|uniref:hypothetical protein n=1 Tax=unclassified Actinoplanes TaxID=2626549 RepID=UPI003441A10F
MESRVITKDVIKRIAARSAKASMRLEGRVVPPGFVRSAKAEEFLKRRSKAV